MNATYLFRNFTITDPVSNFNLQTLDILVIDGIIAQIGSIEPSDNYQLIEGNGDCVSPGFFDIGTQVGDPGFESHDTYDAVSKAALAGGFTGLAVLPNSSPVMDYKSMIEYCIHQNQNSQLDIFPIGAISQKCKGEQLAEIYDMKAAGAVAFSDGLQTIQQEGLLVRALQYVKPFNGLILEQPSIQSIHGEGVMNEGPISVGLGLKGMPSMAEFAAIQRDIEICRYTDSRLYFFNATTSKGLSLIKKAKLESVAVDCGIASYYLLLDDSKLVEFESCYKVNPPLRSLEEVEAIKNAVLDNTISVICSWHQAKDYDHKNVEFNFAHYGVINLETCFAAATTAFKGAISPSQLVEKLAINPRKMLDIPVPTIQVGEKANLTFFNTSKKWMYQQKNIQSISFNSPFIDFEFTGMIKGVFNKNCWLPNPHCIQ